MCSDTCPEMWRHVSRECEVIHVSGDSVRDKGELEDEECSGLTFLPAKIKKDQPVV